MELAEESAAESYEMHSNLLSKGFALEKPPSVQEALDGIVPFSCNSKERLFLRNFVQSVPDTSGGRLARWLQPESYVDVNRCTVMVPNAEDMRCHWPSIVTVVTHDQYGDMVQVPNLRVEVKAIPVGEEMNQPGSINMAVSSCTNSMTNSGQYLTNTTKQGRKTSTAAEPDAMTFGGHRPPNLDPKVNNNKNKI